VSTTNSDQTSDPPPHSVADFDKSLETLLSDAERKANDWIEQRSAIQSRLTQLRDTADQLLRRLSTENQDSARNVVGTQYHAPKAHTAVRNRARQAPTTRRMSVEARERIASAQRARWAKQKSR